MTVALTQVSGLPISINDEIEDLFYDAEHVLCSDCGQISLSEISSCLLNKGLMYPENVYKHHREMKLQSHSKKWNGDYVYDVIYLPDGLLGIEYIKTHIFYHEAADGAAAIVQVISGDLLLVLQKNKVNNDPYDIDSHVEEVLMIEASEGDKIMIPSGYYYTFVNTSHSPVVFGRVIGHDKVENYADLTRECGLAYYLIAKNARQEIVVNPRYRTVSDVRSITVKDLNSRAGYSPTPKVPLYEEAANQQEIFVEFLA